MLDKKSLTEQDICTKFITPAILDAGWGQNQFREQVYFTDGRIIVRGRMITRGKRNFADYILYYKPDLPLAIIEAKDNTHSVGAGMQQGLRYGDILDVPFVYSSNGDGFLEHDRTVGGGTVERELGPDQFPSPDELWARYKRYKGIDAQTEAVVTQDYYSDISFKTPRYYQMNAINKVVEAVARGQNRVLLVMATGTGKTFTAFQIIWRLWKSRCKKRILFLADRNVLVDQTKTNDFKPFGKAMTKVTNHQIDKSYEIYLSLYQAITGTDEDAKVFKEFSPDFFDLVIIDECHRGSADEDSAWREILEYFHSATQLGMTATPKETRYISNIDYFGEPIYTYSLKQGIEDGFLAPYKVVRMDIDKDLTGWRPEAGKRDKYGKEIVDRVYNQRDYDRDLILEKRTELVADKVTEFLQGTDRYAKTIVFCVDIDHAERMRQALVNDNADEVQKNSKYVMRITGDNPEGKMELDNFIDPESRYPVIVTTSRLLSTGVDAQTCKLIVLDRRINSMTEFKQIIGRGTRINEEFDKKYFVIMDFRKATEHFADPDFDGDPVQVYEPDLDETPVPPDLEDEGTPDAENVPDGEDILVDPPGFIGGGLKDLPDRYVVDDVAVDLVAKRVQYYDEGGKLVTESLVDYTRKKVRGAYNTLDQFLKHWTSAERKAAVIAELEEQGLSLTALAEEVGKDFDAFDLVCHVAFDQPALTRKERAENVRKQNYFAKYGDQARVVLEAILTKYADEGVAPIEDLSVLRVQPFTDFGTPTEIIKAFGGRNQFIQAIHELEQHLYEKAQA